MDSLLNKHSKNDFEAIRTTHILFLSLKGRKMKGIKMSSDLNGMLVHDTVSLIPMSKSVTNIFSVSLKYVVTQHKFHLRSLENR